MGARASRRGAGAQSRDHRLRDRPSDARSCGRDYADLPEVGKYLDAVEHDIKENVDDFLTPAAPPPEAPTRRCPAPVVREIEDARFRRYQVNVIVDNGGRHGAPVIYEDNPTHQTLVGRVEHLARFGALVTDFNLLTPGALHRANGGYLVLDAQKLLTGNLGWASLKRALNAGQIRIETLEQLLSMATTVSLQPEPIPLDLKVVLVGPPALYYLLSAQDEEFAELFKIAADFEDRVERTPETTLLYARMICAMTRREELRPLDRARVARVIEQAARLAGDADKLTTSVRAFLDLLREADQFAADAGKDDRSARPRCRRRSTRRSAAATASIGGCRRRSAARRSASRPTAQQVGPGQRALGDQPRRSRLRHADAASRRGCGSAAARSSTSSARSSSAARCIRRACLILSGFLGGRFGGNRPLSLNASLVFEQSYGGVEGDSASAAELFALLSALAEAPIEQCFAVTGSVDQRGQIQAIGGVNEKIEGFFDSCRATGFTGRQGVIIPASNVKHLMLRHDVVAAARGARFAIYPIDTVDQGLELLTGIPAGAAGRRRQLPGRHAEPADRRAARCLRRQGCRACPCRRPARESGDDRAIERVVVTLDAASENRAAIETAARLAARAKAPLHGIFVEDEDLLRSRRSAVCPAGHDRRRHPSR